MRAHGFRSARLCHRSCGGRVAHCLECGANGRQKCCSFLIVRLVPGERLYDRQGSVHIAAPEFDLSHPELRVGIAGRYGERVGKGGARRRQITTP